MRTSKFHLLTLLILGLFISPLCLAAVSPVGTWKTIDDVTKKPRSYIRISKVNNQLRGTITRVIPQPGDTGICSKCPGKFENKKIKGLTIMWGLKQQNNYTWGNGKILDPKNGKIYGCRITVSKDGKRLNVRGYLGLTILGRTQVWYRSN